MQMFARRAVFAAVKATPRAAFVARSPVVKRSFTAAAVKLDKEIKGLKNLDELSSEEDLLPPGGAPGTVPTDLDQATGLERLELLGKIQGIDVFDMKPLDSSRTGTMEDPIIVTSFGEEQYAGCTGSPADSHVVKWLTISRDRPIERCPECGSVYKMDFVGKDDEHGHHHGYSEPKTMADFIKPEYKYR